MYWPTASTRRIHLGPSGLHTLPPASPQEAAAAHERHAAALVETRERQRSVAEQGTTNERPRVPRRTSATPDAPSSSTLAREIAASVAAEEREQLVDLARSPDGVYFACLSAHTLSLWTQRPTQVVAAIRRTRASVAEHGRSMRVYWAAASGDEPRRLALQTDRHVLLLYRVLEPRESVYAYVPVLPDSPSLPSGPRRVHSHSRSISLSGLTTPKAPLVSASGERYAPAPQAMTNIFGRTAGEIPHAHSGLWSSTRPPLPKQVAQALDEHSGAARAGSANADLVVIEFSLAMQMDAGLSGCTATEDHVVVATSDPPAIQVIPWPSDTSSGPARKTHTTLLRRMPWLQLHPPIGEGPRTKPSSQGPSTSQPNGQTDEPELGHITAIEHSPSMGLYVWLSSDGRAHTAIMAPDLKPPAWTGHTFHGTTPTTVVGSPPTPISTKGKHRASQETTTGPGPMPIPRQATCSAINAPFSLLAIGTRRGVVEVYAYQPGVVAQPSHALHLPADYALGTVTSLAWTSDGYALAVGYERGWAVFSTYGRLLACSHRDSWTGIHRRFNDDHLFGTTRLFWAMGNHEVVLLARPDASAPGTEPKFDPDAQLYALPFIRSAQATLGDGAMAASSGYGLLHAGDKLVLYRGRELSEWQVITPDAASAPKASQKSHVEGAAQGQTWQHIRLPPRYLAFNWPIRCAALSQDAGWIAIAGRRGFAVSCVSPTAHALAYANAEEADVPGVGQWRMFDLAQISQEQAFTVRGGIGWMGHLVIVATDAGGEAQLRVYDARAPLDNSRLLAMERVPAPIVQMRVYPDPESTPKGASILLYTVTNQLYHVRIAAWGQVVRHAPLFLGDPGTPTTESYAATKLTVRTMGSLSLAGIVSEPTRIRSVDWLVPSHLARSAGVLNKATLVLLINGRLMLLRPHTLAQTTSVPQQSQTNGAASGPPSQTDGPTELSTAVPTPTAPAEPRSELPNSNGETKSPTETAPKNSIEAQANEPQASTTGTDATTTDIPTPGASTSSLAPTASAPQLVTVLASAPGPQARSLSASTTSLPTVQVQIAYDAQVLADQVELVWTTSMHTGAPKPLENTLWAYVEGRGLRVWKETGKDVTHAKVVHHASTSSSSLAKEIPPGSTGGSTSASTSTTTPVPQQGTILPLDFYPLCLLSARGVVVGMESNLVLRKSLDFGLWRTGTVTHLFLPGLLRHTLSVEKNPLVTDAVPAAIELARPYASLGYFAHALEILLHAVLEDAADGGPSPATEAATSTPPTSSRPGTPIHSSLSFTDASPSNDDARKAVLQAARKAQQADQDARGAEELRRTLQLVLAFPQAISVIANCARKTEASRWSIFFEAAGKTTHLLDRALQQGDTRTAAAYLLLVFNLEPEFAEVASVNLVRAAVQQQEFSRALDVLRFLVTLRPDDPQFAARVVRQADFLPRSHVVPESKQHSSAVSDSEQHAEAEIVASLTIDTPEAPNGANGTATPDTTQDVAPRPSVTIALDEPKANGIASHADEPAPSPAH